MLLNSLIHILIPNSTILSWINFRLATLQIYIQKPNYYKKLIHKHGHLRNALGIIPCTCQNQSLQELLAYAHAQALNVSIQIIQATQTTASNTIPTTGPILSPEFCFPVVLGDAAEPVETLESELPEAVFEANELLPPLV